MLCLHSYVDTIPLTTYRSERITTMALAAQLLPGYQYRIIEGPFSDEVVTIVDAKPFPDTHPERRKVTVLNPQGKEFYILPRQLTNTPEAQVNLAPAPVFNVTPGPSHTPAQTFQVGTPGPKTGPVDTSDYEATVAPMTQQQVVKLTMSHQLVAITDPMDPRLDHLRPSRAKVKQYINRTMPNGMSDVEYLLTYTNDDYRSRNQGRPANIMLKGDTQSGKTFLVEVLAVKWAEMLGLPKPMPIFTLSGSSGITDYDLFGQTTSFTDVETGTESLVWLHGLAEMAVQVGGILYLDEINAFGERVTTSLHPVADHRHTFTNRNKPVWKNGQFMPDTVTASFDLWIIGTYNEGYKGMGEMNEAFINRFRHIRWGYDKDVEAKLIQSPAIRLLGEALRTARDNSTIRTPVGTKALQNIEEDLQSFGVAIAMDTFKGMFKANEVPLVDEILEGRSIFVLLQEELRQASIEATH